MDTVATRSGDREERTRGPDGVSGVDEVADGVYRPRTFCGDCGGRGHAHSDVLDASTMRDRLPRLAERVREEGVALDEEALYRTVRVGKSTSALQGRDRELYAAAVQLAVEFAYGRR